MSAGGRQYAGESAEQRAERRRRRLLDAGLDVFGTVGFRRATVRRLCREARVADRYFYSQFDGTEDLLRAVYHDCLDELQRTVATAIEGMGEDVEELATAGLEAFLRRLEDDPRIARVAWFEVLGVSPEVDAAYLRRTQEFGELLVLLLDDRGLLGASRPHERSIVSSALVGGVSQVVQQWVHAGFTPARSELVPALSRFLLAGLALSHER